MQFPPSPPDSAWGHQHQTAPTESTCSPPRPPTIAFVLAPAAHPQGTLPSGPPLRSCAAAQRNPNCVLPAKGIINLPAEGINAWCLLPKTRRAAAASVVPCRGSPQAMEGPVLAGSPLWTQARGAAAPPLLTSSAAHHWQSRSASWQAKRMVKTIPVFLLVKGSWATHMCKPKGKNISRSEGVCSSTAKISSLLLN